MRSQAIRRLTVSLLCAAVIGILPVLPAATPARVHLATRLASSNPWLDRFNTWRTNTGVPAVTEDTTFSAGDVLHATYMVQTGQITHGESTLYPQYTLAGDIAGQNSNIFVSSTTATTDSQAIDWWMGAPFHAMAMMDPRLATTGFGSYRNAAYTWAMGAAVNVGQGMTAPGAYPVFFPGNLSTEPLTSFSGNEFPNPQLACPGYTGLPLFVEVGGNVATTAGPVHSLTGNGTPLAHCIIDSTNATLPSDTTWHGGVIVFPQSPLQNGVTYTVALTVNSIPYTWSFTVGAFSTCTLGAGGAPTVTSVTPSAGPVSGGTTATLHGCGFTGAAAVKFGAATSSFTFVSDTQLTAVSPAHAAGAVDVAVTTPLGSSAVSAGDKFQFQPPSVYTAVTPVRLLDTRNGGPIGSGGSLNLAIVGVGSVPSTATAVVLNVTAVNESTGGAFTVYPAGVPRPLASNLNWAPHETVPNLVTVGLGTSGNITIFNGTGTADAVVDLEGYYAPSSGGTAGEYQPVVPGRITDTRPGSGKANAGMTLTSGGTLDVQVTGAGGIPVTGVTAVVMNVTATNTTASGFFTVYPTGRALPVASNLNWTAGVTVPNRVIVPVGTGGKVSVHNGAGNADLIVDVNGYFTDATGSGASFTALTPSRIIDTRNGTGGVSSPLGQGQIMIVTVAGNGGVPAMTSATPPSAVVLNVTVESATAASDLVVWPDGASAPVASDLNFARGQTVPNLVIVKLSAGGKVDIRNDFGSTSVIVDVVGWYG
jgi:IPT/TIG domain